jgi:DNA-binding NarL/FixJ family response regulator
LIARDVLGSLTGQRTPRNELTARQREVLQLLAEGKSMKEVATAMPGWKPLEELPAPNE